MKLNLKALTILTLGLWVSQSANATVLTFDDLAPLTTSPGTIANGYGGLDWTDMGYLNSSQYGSATTGYVGGTVSGDYVAFNEFARVATVSDGVFDFNSAYLASAWNDNLSVTVQGFLGGSELYNVTVNNLQYSQTLGATATLINFNFLGIDSLVFTSFGGTDADANDGGGGAQFVMDNFTFNETVPEPATLALLSLGLFGIGAARRFRK